MKTSFPFRSISQDTQDKLCYRVLAELDLVLRVFRTILHFLFFTLFYALYIIKVKVVVLGRPPLLLVAHYVHIDT